MNTTQTMGWRDLRWLLLGAAIYRTLFWAAMPRVLDSADAIHYVEAAQRFAALEFLSHDPKIPPLYPLLGALTHVLAADLEFALRLVSFFFSLLTVIPVYGLALRLHGRRAAQFAAITVILWPWLADYGSRVSTEAVAVCLWLLAVWGLVAVLDGDRRWAWGSAAAFVGLYLCRAEGLFLFLAVFPVVIAANWSDRRTGIRDAIPFAVLLLAAAVPYALYTRALTGTASANYRVGFIVAEFDVLRFADTAYKTVFEVLPVMLGPILLVFLGIGLLQTIGERRALRAATIVLAFSTVQWAASLFVLSPAPRYLMAPIIVLSLWSAGGVEHARMVLHKIGAGWLRHLPLALVICAMVGHGLITVGSEHLGRRPREPREYKVAGEWMRAHLEPGLIFTRKPQVAYYAGMPSTGPALDDTLEGALSRAQDAGARYLVVDERYGLESMRPLLEPERAPVLLEHLQSFDPYPESRVVVYRLRPGRPAE